MAVEGSGEWAVGSEERTSIGGSHRETVLPSRSIDLSSIQRHGVTRRWSDAVVHGGVAQFVEVPDELTPDLASQVRQVLAQIDARLALVGSDRTQLLQVLIYLADLSQVATLNEQWDAWVPEGHAPARACVQVGLAKGLLVEMVVTAASKSSDS